MSHCTCGKCRQLTDPHYLEELASALSSIKVEELVEFALSHRKLEAAEAAMFAGLGMQCQLLVQDSKGMIPDVGSAAKLCILALLEGLTKLRTESRNVSLNN